MKKDRFYDSREWKRLRYLVLRNSGGRCQCCGSLGPLHVDHIKPRSLYPKLELSFKNLQVLCPDCNRGKSNIDKTDWRNKSHPWFAWIEKCPDPKIKKQLKKNIAVRSKKAVDEFLWAGGTIRR
jgi:5-methylcytosine-specific restriction endonuclease McrA